MLSLYCLIFFWYKTIDLQAKLFSLIPSGYILYVTLALFFQFVYSRRNKQVLIVFGSSYVGMFSRPHLCWKNDTTEHFANNDRAAAASQCEKIPLLPTILCLIIWNNSKIKETQASFTETPHLRQHSNHKSMRKKSTVLCISICYCVTITSIKVNDPSP